MSRRNILAALGTLLPALAAQRAESRNRGGRRDAVQGDAVMSSAQGWSDESIGT